MESLLFYDLETTGLGVCFDQPVQAAAVRVNRDLVETDRAEFKIRLRGDVVPSLGALEVTRLLPSKLADGDSEYHAALRLHRFVNRPGTISIGYNTLGFDDQVLAFLFYRNMLDPYTHRYLGGCGRADVLAMIPVFVLFAPDVLRIPTREDGKPTFALSHMAAANEIDDAGAHEAAADVDMTIGLYRKMHAARPDFMQWLLRKFEKRYDIASNDKLEKIPVGDRHLTFGILVSARAHDAHYQQPAVRLGTDARGRESWMLIEGDFEAYLGGDQSCRPWIVHRRPGDVPLVIPFSKAVLDAGRRERLSANRAILARVGTSPFLESESPEWTLPKHIDLDARLYDEGFFDDFRASREDIDRFHQAMTLEMKHRDALAMRSERFREMALRILYRNYDDHPLIVRAAKDFHRVRRAGGKGADGLDFRGKPRRIINDLCQEIQAALEGDSDDVRKDFLDRVMLEFGIDLPEAQEPVGPAQNGKKDEPVHPA